MVGVVTFLSVACLFLLILYLNARSKIGKLEIRYVDTSGIVKNPPSFIETWRNKTINFKFGKETISIPHLPIIENVQVISKLAGSFKVLSDGMSNEAIENVGETRKNTYYVVHYFNIVDMIYRISKPFAKGWFFKYRFYKKALEDSNFIFGIAEQVFDYWQNMGKLLEVLSKGATPRMIYGESLSSPHLSWGKDGKRLIKPRFDFIPKSNMVNRKGLV